jgi:hypothetical protein
MYKNKMNTDINFEIYVKYYLEPIFNYYLPQINNSIQENPSFNDIYLILTGGDALNYYYSPNNQFLTHDFDLRIIRLGNHFDFNNLPTYINPLCEQILIELTKYLNNFINLIKQNHHKISKLNTIYGQKLINLQFYYAKDPNFNLHTILYNYTNQQNQLITSSVVDLFIYAKNSPIPAGDIQNINSNFNQKFTDNYNIINWIKNNYTLIVNEIELIVKDQNTNIYYMALGDLLNDTSKMILISTYLLPYNSPNNKLYKYIEKYAKLITTINKITLNLKCNMNNINQLMCLKENTNIDCNGKIITDINQYNTQITEFILEYYITKTDLPKGYISIQEMIKHYPINKKCSIALALKLDS